MSTEPLLFACVRLTVAALTLQLASNRRSAQRSDGPRTSAGKYRSALNAENRRVRPEAWSGSRKPAARIRGEFLRLYPVREIMAETAEVKARETPSSRPERSLQA